MPTSWCTGMDPYRPLEFSFLWCGIRPPHTALPQVEKVALFCLATRGGLARRLHDARRENNGWKTGETSIFCGATRKEMGEKRVSETSLSPQAGTYCPCTALSGGEITELMRFFNLNGKSLAPLVY